MRLGRARDASGRGGSAAADSVRRRRAGRRARAGRGYAGPARGGRERWDDLEESVRGGAVRARAGRRARAPCGAGGTGREAALEQTWAGNKPDADGVLAGAAVRDLLPPPPDAAAGVCAGGGCGGRNSGDAWTVTARSQVGEKLGGSAVDSTGEGARRRVAGNHRGLRRGHWRSRRGGRLQICATGATFLRRAGSRDSRRRHNTLH